MARCAGFFFARRVRGRLFFVHCVRLLLAPRAMSSRSGCASSAALRPAFACDRAGAARRAEPRCSPPSEETLGRGQRLHPPVWPLGARTLQRHGSSRPRGGFHRHPPAREVPPGTGPFCWVFGPVNRTAPREGGSQSARRVQAAIPPEAAGTQRADRDGVSVTPSLADTEGPRNGTRCWVAVEGVSERSERGRARDERTRTRWARAETHAVRRKRPTATSLRGKTKAVKQ
jgi:hypothetical protein